MKPFLTGLAIGISSVLISTSIPSKQTPSTKNQEIISVPPSPPLQPTPSSAIETSSKSIQKEVTEEVYNKEYHDIANKLGLPMESAHIEKYSEFISSIDYSKRIPNWVAYTLNRNLLDVPSDVPKADRQFSRFVSECKNTPVEFRAQNKDYWNSGWSRGHLSPASDHRLRQEGLNETFILSANIVPQNMNNNGNYWRRFEMYSGGLASQFEKVHIITGPLFVPVENTNPPSSTPSNVPPIKWMTYPVIGVDEVHVPTHLFKILVVENSKQEIEAIGCFAVPNEPIPSKTKLEQFAVPLSFIEQKVGAQFFHKIKDTKYQLPFLCEKTSCEMVSQEVIDQLNYGYKIKAAKSREELETIWSEVQSRNFNRIEDHLTQAWSNRNEEFKRVAL